MRYKKFLKEDIYNPHASDLYNGVLTVYKHCKPFISDLVKGNYNYLTKSEDLLYSGRNESLSVISKEVRKDRKPTDMDHDLHSFYDMIFYKTFGIKSRSNSIFCSGNLHVAGGYGLNVYIIFPAGKYQSLWSDEIKDLYNNPYTDQIITKYQSKYNDYRQDILSKSDDLKKELKLLPWNILNISNTNPIKQKLFKELYKEFNKEIMSTYHKNDIINGIKSNKEIMLTCKYYIGLKYNDYNRVIKQYIEQNKTKFPEKEFFMEWYDRYIE
jgi:hypothetical protein